MLPKEAGILLALGLLLTLCCTLANADSVPCKLRETTHGNVCVCTDEYCDYLDDPTPADDAEFAIVSSTKAGLRFETTSGTFNLFKKVHILDYDQRLGNESTTAEFDPVSLLVEDKSAFIELASNNQKVDNTRFVTVNIDRSKQHQKIVGFGGSMTGAVSHILQHLSQKLQDHLYESYYAKHGIGFNLMRMSIGGCDFDLAPWAYNEEPENDLELSNFNKLDERDIKKIEQIKRLKEVSKVDNLRIKGAAWSSPRWMKTNNKWTGRSSLKKEYYQTWADYHLKWLELMEENDLPIWAISTGNEPLNGVAFMYFVRFMSLGWTPGNQAIWLAENLGPTIRNSKYKDIIIFGNDDQRYTFPTWFHWMKRVRSNSVDYLDGLAVHWYWDEIIDASLIDQTHVEMPEKMLISSESCIGDKPWQKSAPLLGSWKRGEKYARAFLQDLQHNFNGWIDWNLVLDEIGGPNYVDNTVDAPIIVDMSDTTEILKQPMFYTMGHFSKFLPENSVRIESKLSNINVDTVAFQRPDGTIAVVLFNSGNAVVEVSLMDTMRGSFVVKVPARSIHTVLYR